MDPLPAKITFALGYVVANYVIRTPHIKTHRRLPIRSHRKSRLDIALFLGVILGGFLIPLLYLSIWLLVIAQPMILPNYVAGFAGLLPFAILYFQRIAKEERMMLDEFGSEYERYVQRTGRLLPNL